MTEDDKLRLAREIAESYRGKGAGPVPRSRGRKTSRKDKPARDEPVPLSEVMGELVDKQGWADQLAAQRVFTDWATIVGPEVAQHTQVEGYEDLVVSVRASSTAWATQLRLLAPRIVARLNEEIGQGSVIRIDVRGPQAPSWTKGKRSVKGRGPRDTYG